MKGELANNQALRRSCRVLAMVHELHKMGYQHLAIYPGISPSGAYWRCEVLPFRDLFFSLSGGLECQENSVRKEASYTSGDSNLYFGWDDATRDTARELAAKFLERFPDICAASNEIDFQYAGWLTFVIGESERGRLPVMYSDSTSYGPSWLGSPEGPALLAPPHYQLQQGDGFQYIRFSLASDYLNKNDWHTAYQKVVRDMADQYRESTPVFVPNYPVPESTRPSEGCYGVHCEVGAYWEGAIYFIQEILGYTDVVSFLSDSFTGNHDKSTLWKTFELTWNSRGQLELLLAFLIRYALNKPQECNPGHHRSTQLEEWLRDFDARYPRGIKYPNPYFGGSNPLHLGPILDNKFGSATLIKF